MFQIFLFFHSHTNQFLKSYTPQDADDWDTGVSSSLSCTRDRISSVLGLQFCLSESHAELPKSVTQTPSLANPVHSKWKLLVHPIDEKHKSYDLEMIQTNEMRSSEVILKFSTAGRDNKQEMLFNADINTSKGKMSFKVKIPPLPDFSILYLQNMLLKNSKGNGYRVTASMNLCKNYQYELIYNVEMKEKRIEKDGAESSGVKTEATIVCERYFSLGTPHNSYRSSVVNHKNRLNTKILLSYENIDLSGAWLHTLLPSSLWETDLKAWIEFQITGEDEEKDKLVKKRQIICFIRDPQSIIELNADLMRMSGRNQLIVNAMKKEICSQKVLAFASFYYDLRNERIKELSEKEIKVFNLTISRKSWAMEVQKEKTGGKVSWEIVMRCKNAENSNNVSERTMEPPHTFQLHRNQLKFLVSTEVQVMGSQELINRYSTLTLRDVEGLGNQLTAVNLQFYYPFSSKLETASLDGYFIISGGPTTFRFQNDFVMESSYNNLQLTSHSVYKSDGTYSTFDHESYMTHLPSTTRASNAIHFWLFSPVGHCIEAGFRHSVVSRLFDLSTNVTYRCNSNGKDLHTLLLQSRMNSSVWNMLNLYINQIVEDLSPEYTYETCNVTHPSMVINVTADWKGEEMSDHRKTALFTCTKKDCQRTILLIEVLHSGRASAKLILPNDENQVFSLQRTISADSKNLNLSIKYSDNEDEESEDLQLKGEIINNNYHVWSLRIHLDTFARVKSLLANSFRSIIYSLVSLARDPDHPVNKLAHSSIQMTLYDYFRNLRGQGNNLIRSSWTSLKDSLESLKPFSETPLTLVWNIASIRTMKEHRILEEESAPGWIHHYFDLAVGFFKSETSFIEAVLKKFLLDNREFRWEFITDRVLKMESFRE
ncbi:apolipoprotein B-100, partial [Trichonephila clavata]